MAIVIPLFEGTDEGGRNVKLGVTTFGGSIGLGGTQPSRAIVVMKINIALASLLMLFIFKTLLSLIKRWYLIPIEHSQSQKIDFYLDS
jgi:hypothetical protein